MAGYVGAIDVDPLFREELRHPWVRCKGYAVEGSGPSCRKWYFPIARFSWYYDFPTLYMRTGGPGGEAPHKNGGPGVEPPGIFLSLGLRINGLYQRTIITLFKTKYYGSKCTVAYGTEPLTVMYRIVPYWIPCHSLTVFGGFIYT